MIEWTTACPDWTKRILAGESLIPFAPLFPDEAQSALDIFGDLRMVDVIGSPTMAEVVRPWVVDFVGAVFGAYDHGQARRLINEFMLLISKKNGKSTIAAGVMLTALLQNWRHSGEFIILAPTKEVADNSFKPIRDMVAADDRLGAFLHVQPHLRTVTDTRNESTLKVVAADSDTVSGKKAIGIFVDELHEFGKRAQASNMLLEATGGLVSRPEGFVIYATTHSESPPAGIFRQKLLYARKVRDGLVEDKAFLPVLYEFPPEMEITKENRKLENAYITNPNWGASVDTAYIERKYKQAREDGEDAFRQFLAKHMNIETGLALGSDRWVGADFWEAAEEKGLTLDELLNRSEVCVVGIDGGGLDDLLGLAVVGRCKTTRRWLHWGYAWAHKIALERRKSEAPKLHDFASEGDLTVVDLPGQDVEELTDIVMRIEDMGLLADKGIGVDAAGIGDIVDSLTDREIDIERIIGVSQGWRLNAAIKQTERRLAGGELVHCGQPIMAWSVGNARVEPRGNAVSITKQASGTAKIDPLMALLCANTLMALNPEAKGVSFWERNCA